MTYLNSNETTTMVASRTITPSRGAEGKYFIFFGTIPQEVIINTPTVVASIMVALISATASTEEDDEEVYFAPNSEGHRQQNHELSSWTSKEEETLNQKGNLTQNCLYTQGLPEKNSESTSRASGGLAKYPCIQSFLRFEGDSRRLFHRSEAPNLGGRITKSSSKPEEVSLISGPKRKEESEN
jgi:hypothetical protein